MTDIVVILYGDRKDFDILAKSLEEHCHDYNLIVMDNNPPNQNLGYTKACNEGLRLGKAPFCWLLNQDAVVLPRAQDALIARLKSDSKAGIVGSMQIDQNDRDIIRHGGTSQVFPGGIHKGGRISMGHCRFPEKQTWVNGASMMLRREMVEKIGFMDEQMFLLCSDSDYCFTARQRGWDVWYEPRSVVIHRLNASKKPSEWHRKDTEAFMKKWGIQQVAPGQFAFSREFDQLNRFP